MGNQLEDGVHTNEVISIIGGSWRLLSSKANVDYWYDPRLWTIKRIVANLIEIKNVQPASHLHSAYLPLRLRWHEQRR